MAYISIRILVLGIIPFLVSFSMAVGAAPSALDATQGKIVSLRGPVMVATDPWCPYSCLAESPKPGYLIEMGKQIFESEGYEFRYINLPWKRTLEETLRGNLDAAVGVSAGPKLSLTLGAEPVGVDESVFVTRKGESFCFDSVAALKGKRIGVVANYSYDSGGPIDQYLAQSSDTLKIFSEDALTKLFELLKRHRIDMFLESRLVADYKSQELHIQSDISFTGTGSKNFLYYAFQPSERGAHLATVFDKGVQSLRGTGQLQDILARYGMQDWLDISNMAPTCPEVP